MPGFIVNGNHIMIKNCLDFIFSWALISFSFFSCVNIWIRVSCESRLTQEILLGAFFAVFSSLYALRVEERSTLTMFSFGVATVLPCVFFSALLLLGFFSQMAETGKLFLLIIEYFLIPHIILFVRFKYFLRT